MFYDTLFENVTVIGLGLVGSSVARAAREYKLATHITGCDASELTLGYARSHEIADNVTRDPALAVGGSQIVIIATPPSTFAEIAARIAPALAPGTIVMDTGSVKRAAVEAIESKLPDHAIFIPAHPIAGGEKSGIHAGRADLFQKKRVIVSPAEAEQTDALKKITQFWQGMGARVEGIPAGLHDKIYAYVSHLPQLLAFAAKHSIQYKNEPQLQPFLRISGSSPDLWIDIFALNHDYLLAGLDRYLDAITHVHRELATATEGGAGDEILAQTKLFPRIAASCLITTVMEAEKNEGVPFARLAGGGFADFTSPASSEPEGDMEKISGASSSVAATLTEYIETLQSWRSLIALKRFDELRKRL
jgi:cyclohexadieny/prephenate dehydrogenase